MSKLRERFEAAVKDRLIKWGLTPEYANSQVERYGDGYRWGNIQDQWEACQAALEPVMELVEKWGTYATELDTRGYELEAYGRRSCADELAKLLEE